MKKFFAGLFVFIILVVYPATLLVTTLRYAVLQPTAIKRIVHVSQIGERLPAILAEQSKEDGDPEQAQMMDAIGDSLTPTDIYHVADQAVDVTAEWLGTSKSIEQLDLKISTATIKSKLLANAGEGADLNFIPDELTTRELLSQTETGTEKLGEWNTQLDQVRSVANSIFMFMWIGWVVIVFSFLMIALLRHKPGYGVLGWYGWTLLLMTMECIPLVVVFWLAPDWILPWVNGNATATILAVINDALGELMRHLIMPLSIVMASTLLVGIAFLVIKALIKRRKHSLPQ